MMSKSSMMMVVLLLVHSSSTTQPLRPDQQSDEVTYDLGNCHKIIQEKVEPCCQVVLCSNRSRCSSPNQTHFSICTVLYLTVLQ